MRIWTKDDQLMGSDESLCSTTAGADDLSPISVEDDQLRFEASPADETHELGIYIVYLEPDGALAQDIARARDSLGELFGKDESFQYPLHCSLTGFFEISTFSDACAKDSVVCSIHEAIHTFVSRFRDPDSQVLYNCQGRITLDPARTHPTVSAYNNDLEWIKLSQDGGLFLPLQSRWFQERLPALRELLTESLQSHCLVPLQIQSRRGCQGIQLKRADHVSLLDGKSRPRPLAQAFEAAKLVDSVIKTASENALPWDMVVYELEEWGTEDYSPHRMRELVRVPRVIVQQLLTEQ